MKSYGQMIYEAYAREHGLRHMPWDRVDPAEKEEWDRIGQDVATQMHPPDHGPNHLRSKA